VGDRQSLLNALYRELLIFITGEFDDMSKQPSPNTINQVSKPSKTKPKKRRKGQSSILPL